MWLTKVLRNRLYDSYITLHKTLFTKLKDSCDMDIFCHKVAGCMYDCVKNPSTSQ